MMRINTFCSPISSVPPQCPDPSRISNHLTCIILCTHTYSVRGNYSDPHSTPGEINGSNSPRTHNQVVAKPIFGLSFSDCYFNHHTVYCPVEYFWQPGLVWNVLHNLGLAHLPRCSLSKLLGEVLTSGMLVLSWSKQRLQKSSMHLLKLCPFPLSLESPFMFNNILTFLQGCLLTTCSLLLAVLSPPELHALLCISGGFSGCQASPGSSDLFGRGQCVMLFYIIHCAPYNIITL